MVFRLRHHQEELVSSNEELRERNRQLLEARAAATTDPVTGIPNHRQFQECIRMGIEECEREGVPLSLVMLDIDRFKAINDAFGHVEGDRILRELGLVLMGLDDGARAFRYGGDEFALLLPGATIAEAHLVAEGLRERVRTIGLPRGGTVTVSLGISSFPETADELIGADSAMYQAKANGKNRVEFAVSGVQTA